jgi:outer membrane lipoprotein carrier protein
MKLPLKQIAIQLLILGVLMFGPHGAAFAQDNTESGTRDSADAGAGISNQEAARQLAKRLKTYETFQANFIQIVVDGSGSRVQETRGVIKAKRPGLFYWESESPLAQIIVSDGEQVEVYDPDLEQVTVKPMNNQLSSTPALLLSGEVSNLSQAYEVSTREAKGGARDFRLEPKNPDSLFVSLRLRFRDSMLSEMRLRDSLDQISVLSFRDVAVNEPIPDSAFSMDYPEGVDVIRGAQ